MSKKILAVFGATGVQGRSVIDAVLHDAELSSTYSLRAITRDPASTKAQQLPPAVQVARADALDSDALATALQGVHTVFIMTMPTMGPDSVAVERDSAVRIADAAVAQGAQYLIFSTLPSVAQLSGGRYTGMLSFEGKAAAEAYMRTLPIRSAYFAPTTFMENFVTMPFLGPQRAKDGSDTWVLQRHTSGDSKVPFIAAGADTGKFIGAILAEPDKFVGKTLGGLSQSCSMVETAEIISKVTGKKVVFEQVSVEEFKSGVPWMPEIFAEGFSFADEYGFLGDKTNEILTWSQSVARGKLTTLEEFLTANPIQLP